MTAAQGPGPISDAELAVLKVLWEQAAGTVREVQAVLQQQGELGRKGGKGAYTTVQTLLTRLESKGYVTCDRAGAAHVFRPAVTRDDFLRRRLTDLADQVCAGTASPLLMALVEGGRFTADEIDQFRRLLDRLEHSPAPSRKRG